MGDVKLWGRWWLADSETPYEATLAAIYFEPAIKVLVRTGELMLMAGAFHTAANVTHMGSLKVLASIMYFTLSVYLFLASWRYIVMPVSRAIRLKATILNFFVMVAIAGGLLWLINFLNNQIIEASRHLVLAC